MMMLWIMSALLAALAGLLVLAGARRGAGAGEAATVSAATELSELDRLKARGLLDEAGWTAVYTPTAAATAAPIPPSTQRRSFLPARTGSISRCADRIRRPASARAVVQPASSSRALAASGS